MGGTRDGTHFVRSKVICWVVLDRGTKLSEECPAPVGRRRKVREEIRAAVEGEGYDEGLGTFVRAFGSKVLDAALLLLPKVGFVGYDDERTIRTADAIREELDDDGLLERCLMKRRRGRVPDLLVLARRMPGPSAAEEARKVFDRLHLQRSRAILRGVPCESRRDARELPARSDPPLVHLSHDRDGGE